MAHLNAEYDKNYRDAMGDAPAKKSVKLRYPDGEEHIKLIPRKVTIYHQGEFGGAPRAIEATDYNYAIGPYAQYPKALFVFFTPKGKRNVQSFVDSYSPTTLIIEGWNHPKSAGETMTVPTKTGTGFITSQSRYLMHDERYTTEAKDFMDNYIKTVKAKVIVDFRK